MCNADPYFVGTLDRVCREKIKILKSFKEFRRVSKSFEEFQRVSKKSFKEEFQRVSKTFGKKYV